MTDQIKKLESEIIILKARMNDVRDDAEQARAETSSYREHLSKIIEALGNVEVSQGGQVTIEAVLARVNELRGFEVTETAEEAEAE
jgi:alanine-alpha-ketoisovalerate/valine-pyruvate aminotransferase